MCPTGTSAAAPSQKSNLRTAFDLIDGDGDGKISYDDLRSFYGDSVQDDVIGSMITAADANRDGFVEYDEFQKVLVNNKNGGESKGKGKNGNIHGVMEDAFRVMDKDGDGKVGHEDLKSYLSLAGFDDVGDEDVKAMIRLGGGGGENGGVSFEGLMRILSV